MNRIEVEVSAGELLDKISILEIKRERIAAQEKLRNIERELKCLLEVKNRTISVTPEIEELFSELKAVNERLWEIEDRIRECERRKDFGPEFVELARSVYMQNDGRARIKRELNDRLGSLLVEEKSYADYASTVH